MTELPSFTPLYRRSQKLYLALASALAAGGYVLLWGVPAITLYLLLDLPFSWVAAETGSASFFVLLQALTIGLLGWISYDLYRLRLKAPGSNRLAPNQYPELWEIIGKLEEVFPKAIIDRVSLTSRFELELVRTPQHALPIKYTTTLLLGLPLLQTLSKEHITALLARKMALIPATRNWPLGWIYHCRMYWAQYAALSVQRWSPGSVLIHTCFAWYAPYFERATIHAARIAELKADYAGLAAVDEWSMEEAVTSYTLRKFFVENKLWPAIMRMAQKYPKPPLLPMASMGILLAKEFDQDRAHRLFDRLMRNSASYDMTSLPPLKQRWGAIGNNRPRLPLPVQISAAHHLLGDNLIQFQQEMDKAWLRANLASWKGRFHKAQKDQVRLQELIEQLPKDLLSNEEIWECTVLVKRYMGQEKAVEFYKAVLETLPREAEIYFKIGSFLLECRDRAGVKALETAMTLDRKYTTEACELISEFMHFTGERRRARTYQRRAVDFSDSIA